MNTPNRENYLIITPMAANARLLRMSSRLKGSRGRARSPATRRPAHIIAPAFALRGWNGGDLDEDETRDSSNTIPGSRPGPAEPRSHVRLGSGRQSRHPPRLRGHLELRHRHAARTP